MSDDHTPRKYTDDEILAFILLAGQNGRWFNSNDVIRAAGYHPSFRSTHGSSHAAEDGLTGLKIVAVLRKKCRFERWDRTRALYRVTGVKP